MQSHICPESGAYQVFGHSNWKTLGAHHPRRFSQTLVCFTELQIVAQFSLSRPLSISAERCIHMNLTLSDGTVQWVRANFAKVLCWRSPGIVLHIEIYSARVFCQNNHNQFRQNNHASLICLVMSQLRLQ